METHFATRPGHFRLFLGIAVVIRICGQDLGVQNSIDDLLGLIQEAVDDGYQRIKLKVKRGWDIMMLEAVRSAFPNAVFHVDCNSGYDLNHDLATLESFDRFNLAMIEQPLVYTDLSEHAELQHQIATPICLDESIQSPCDFQLALKIGACRVANVKPGRVGGLHNAVQIHNLACDAGIPAWVGSMFESGMGVGICAALATLPGFMYPADLFPSGRWYTQDITKLAIQLNEHHCVVLNDAAGVGFEPVPAHLDAATIAREVFGRECAGRAG